MSWTSTQNLFCSSVDFKTPFVLNPTRWNSILLSMFYRRMYKYSLLSINVIIQPFYLRNRLILLIIVYFLPANLIHLLEVLAIRLKYLWLRISFCVLDRQKHILNLLALLLYATDKIVFKIRIFIYEDNLFPDNLY